MSVLFNCHLIALLSAAFVVADDFKLWDGHREKQRCDGFPENYSFMTFYQYLMM